MAAAVITLSNIKQKTSIDGYRAVEATIDFDTGEYVTGGLNLATHLDANSVSVLAKLGLREVRKVYELASADVDAPWTLAEWQTSQDTVSYGYAFDVSAPLAPKLLAYSAGDQLANAAAIGATARARFLFLGN